MSLIRPQSSGRTPGATEHEKPAPGAAAGHRTGAAHGRRGAEALPDPSTLVSNLSLCVIEVLAGARDLNQLARWVSDEVFRHLRLRVALASRAREAKGLRVRRPQVTLGEPRITTPAHGVVEAVVVVHQRGRSRAVAMRLEALDDRWRASAINVL